MFGIAPLTHLFPLQSEWVFFKEDNPTEMVIVSIGIAVVIVIAIIFRIIFRGVSYSARGKGKFTAPRRYNVFKFRRITSNYGLDHDQSKLLEHIFRSDSVSDPLRVMQNHDLLDRHFKRTFRDIGKNSKTDEDAQESLEKLFSLRNVIEATPDEDDAPARLSENTPAILAAGKEKYPVTVITSRGQDAVIETPTNSLGTPIRLPKGAKISLSFFTKSSSGFSLAGEIAGQVQTDSGPGTQINHIGKPKPLAKRKFRRVQTDKDCEFFLINVVESGTGKHKTSKLVVDNKKRFKGTVQDISAGGCSLKTSNPIPVGSRLKLIIEHDESYLMTVLGQAIRTNRSAMATIIHIKFLKVPRRAFNSICALAYGYNDE